MNQQSTMRPIAPILILTAICVTHSLAHALNLDNLVPTKFQTKTKSEEQQEVALETLRNMTVRYAVNSKTKNDLKDRKYILIWTKTDLAPFNYLGKGQEAFIKNGCKHVNCYITEDRKLKKLSHFDAVVFNGKTVKRNDLPSERAPHQRYIYMMVESPAYYPICESEYNNFYNWTATYRLDSDIRIPSILVKNSKGDIIGPKENMKWEVNITGEIEKDLYEKISKKNKLAAWFVTNCDAKNNRANYVSNLQGGLNKYGLQVDVFGECGDRNCSKNLHDKCLKMLEKDYFFYLAFENSFAPDYVTEKVLTALQNDVVPVVYGEANYSRFLPHGSYINARDYTPENLALFLYKLSLDKKNYSNFFKWKPYYTFHNSEAKENVCELCSAMNNEQMMSEQKTYGDIQGWWQPDYKEQCEKLATKHIIEENYYYYYYYR